MIHPSLDWHETNNASISLFFFKTNSQSTMKVALRNSVSSHHILLDISLVYQGWRRVRWCWSICIVRICILLVIGWSKAGILQVRYNYSPTLVGVLLHVLMVTSFSKLGKRDSKGLITLNIHKYQKLRHGKQKQVKGYSADVIPARILLVHIHLSFDSTDDIDCVRT